MRSILAILVLVGVACAELQTGFQLTERLKEFERNPRAFEAQIQGISECIRKLLVDGIPGGTIETFEPLTVDDLDLDLGELGNGLLSGKLTLNDFAVNGITTWQLEDVKGSIIILPPGLKMDLTIRWPKLDYAGDYTIDGSVLGHTVKGAGKISHESTEFGLEISLKGGLFRISVSKLTIKPFVETFELNLDELIVDGEDKSAMIAEKASKIPALVEEHGEKVGAIIADKLKALINGILNRRGVIGDAFKKCIKL